MPRKKDVVKGGAPIARIKENSRLMRTHETMVDFINGRHSSSSILDVFASGLLGLDFLRTFEGELEDDLYYDDDDDDDDEEDDDHFYPQNAAHKHLEPHPRIKQLTDEEADKHAKELIEEEERRKDKTEKNKRKKLRKKEKKRLEKENAVKDILPEEEQGKSDSSENQEESPVIESNADANDSPESGKTENGNEAAGCDESSGNNKEVESLAEMNKTEDGEQKQDLNLNNSFASTAKSVPEETSNQRPARERKKKKTKLQEVQPSKEEKPKIVEKPEVQKKKEEKPEPNKEKTMDSAAEELSKRSRELAGIGNRLAASGQYEMAVKCFTDAIKYNPKEFKLFGNRSLCFERLQQYENALGDADLALSMEPNWIKGLFRKGKALCGLKRYYEASLIYKEVLQLESSSTEATQELKRAQTLHLMEMGFSWAQSSEALKTHATLEEAVEALFGDECNPGPGDACASWDIADQPVVQEEDDDEGEWIVRQTSRPRTQQVKELDAFGLSRSKSQSPTPHSKNSLKPDIISVWVGSLAPAVTYSTLHELFSRAGTVYSIKMLLEQQCAFVNYTRKEDCDRAIQCINGMVVEGAPLAVRYPNKFHNGLGMSRSAASDPFPRLGLYKKECFFWRTTGCTRQDCTFRHVPENKNIDKDKFTSRLGNFM
ncbi:RNA polymerase II-associated protein 3 isoform X1 [Sebastes umbrosus]|uniref:RNA polymerase II-associated protein 3 isoform X1 n=1 Tax=Sebastes umbrosus TaxID=72105 RepID=UPI00189F5A71|nr:RNA polymerase II-associated protein 3 isoform X1 [Sebastes umbrosus]